MTQATGKVAGLPFFTDLSGAPLSGGRVYIGQPNTDPRQNPVSVYYDAAQSVPALQPIGTITGRLARGGQAAEIFVNPPYSLYVTDQMGNQMLSLPNVVDPLIASIGALTAKVVPNIAALRAVLSSQNNTCLVTSYYDVNGVPDGGGGIYKYDPNDSTSVDNGGSVIVASDNGRWKLQSASPWTVEQFGAKGDWNGTSGTDNTAVFQNAFNSLGTAGGKIAVSRDKTYYIAGALTIPVGVDVVGPYDFTGAAGVTTSSAYGSMGAIVLASTQTITMKGDSALRGCLVYRAGMTFPAADATLFAGTALTAAGDDVCVYNCMVLGFAQAFYSTGFQRPDVQKLFFDCTNGIWLDNCADIEHVEKCEGYPFATITPTAPASILTRTGIAYKFTTLGDWGQVTRCFSYGYFRGFSLSSVNSMTLLNCGADNTTSYTGSYGYDILAGCTDTNLIACQAAANDTGFHFNNTTVANLHSQMIGCSSWGNTNNAVLIDGGDVNIQGGIYRSSINGIAINNANSIVVIGGGARFGNSNLDINAFVATSNVSIGQVDFGTRAAGSIGVNSNVQTVTLASATLLNLPQIDNGAYTITGTTAIGGIAGGWTGRTIMLLFTGSCTLGNSATSPNGVSLNGGTNFSAVNGSTITLRHNGTLWYEIGRKSS